MMPSSITYFVPGSHLMGSEGPASPGVGMEAGWREDLLHHLSSSKKKKQTNPQLPVGASSESHPGEPQQGALSAPCSCQAMLDMYRGLPMPAGPGGVARLSEHQHPFEGEKPSWSLCHS